MNDNIIRTGLNLMNTAFNGSGGTVVSGEAVKGGYFVTPSIEITDKGEIGKIPDYACVLGTLCYCTGDNKFYQYRTVTEEIDGVITTVNKWVDVRIDDVAARLDTLIGDDKEKSVRTIANEELAEQLLSDNAEASFKTLQELAAWLEDHPEDVAAINAAIDLLRQDLTKETNRAQEAEGVLTQCISDESARACKKENEILVSLQEETDRAIAEEQMLAESLNKETNKLDILIGPDGEKSARTIADEERAKEQSRAEKVEQDIRDSLNAYKNIIGYIQVDEKTMMETIHDYINDLLFKNEFIIDGRDLDFSENEEETTS